MTNCKLCGISDTKSELWTSSEVGQTDWDLNQQKFMAQNSPACEDCIKTKILKLD